MLRFEQDLAHLSRFVCNGQQGKSLTVDSTEVGIRNNVGHQFFVYFQPDIRSLKVKNNYKIALRIIAVALTYDGLDCRVHVLVVLAEEQVHAEVAFYHYDLLVEHYRVVLALLQQSLAVPDFLGCLARAFCFLGA